MTQTPFSFAFFSTLKTGTTIAPHYGPWYETQHNPTFLFTINRFIILWIQYVNSSVDISHFVFIHLNHYVVPISIFDLIRATAIYELDVISR